MTSLPLVRSLTRSATTTRLSLEAGNCRPGTSPNRQARYCGGTAPLRSTIIRYCSGSRWRAKLKVVFL